MGYFAGLSFFMAHHALRLNGAFGRWRRFLHFGVTAGTRAVKRLHIRHRHQ